MLNVNFVQTEGSGTSKMESDMYLQLISKCNSRSRDRIVSLVVKGEVQCYESRCLPMKVLLSSRVLESCTHFTSHCASRAELAVRGVQLFHYENRDSGIGERITKTCPFCFPQKCSNFMAVWGNPWLNQKD